MKVIVIEEVFEGVVPTDDLDNAVRTAMRPENREIIAAFWFERDDKFVVHTVLAGPEMLDRAQQAGKDPRDVVDQESLQEALAALGQAPEFGALADGKRRLGVLSERFESNGKPWAIGFDSTGGHSYGLYQLASAKGRVAAFIGSLSRTRSAFADVLNSAGGDAAARAGTKDFKAAWQRLAHNEPDFSAVQHAFIKSTHYDPFREHCRRQCKLDVDERSFAVRNVAWSTAVQHGPAASIFRRALGDDASGLSDKDIINRVYDERSQVDIHFKSSKPFIKESVRNRFAEERAAALAMLD